jgi:hypothetical protein
MKSIRLVTCTSSEGFDSHTVLYNFAYSHGVGGQRDKIHSCKDVLM